MNLTKKQKQTIIQELEGLKDYQIEEMYCDMLDDCCEQVDICGYKYLPSRALSKVDPTAFRCGLVDYESSLLDEEYTEIDGQLYRTKEVEDILEEIAAQDENEEEN